MIGPSSTASTSTATLTVNPAADSTTPVLSSFAVQSSTPLAPGDAASVSFSVSDTGSGMQAVIFGFTDPLGGSHQVRADHAAASAGPATATIGSFWPSGVYTLAYVDIFDNANNRITYWPNGAVTKSPSGVIGPSSHSFDFSTATLTINNPAADSTTPVLSSFAVQSSTPLAPGDAASVSFSVSDTGSGMQAVIFGFTDPLGGSHQVRADHAAASAGPATATIGSFWPSGVYTLAYVDIFDNANNRITYWPNGAVTKSPSGVIGPSSHSFDFSTATLTINNGPLPLNVALAGSGSGSVSSAPSGIDCGVTCAAGFDAGSTVTLTATPDVTSTFAGWTGAGCTGTDPCQVTMTQARTVTATFIRIYQLSVSSVGTGGGQRELDAVGD